MSESSAIQEFLVRTANVLETSSVDLDLEFRSLPGWCSMTGFALYVMLEDEYGAKLTVDDFKSLKTIRDLMAAAKLA
jgi:acyl carrier protein